MKKNLYQNYLLYMFMTVKRHKLVFGFQKEYDRAKKRYNTFLENQAIRRGLQKFEFEGIAFYALNEKNAKRKINQFIGIYSK